jgi:hypothetical protein
MLLNTTHGFAEYIDGLHFFEYWCKDQEVASSVIRPNKNIDSNISSHQS